MIKSTSKKKKCKKAKWLSEEALQKAEKGKDLKGKKKKKKKERYTHPTAAAAAAKLLQLCSTLCNPIDGSPPGSAVPGILQARIRERSRLPFPSPTHESEK